MNTTATLAISLSTLLISTASRADLIVQYDFQNAADPRGVSAQDLGVTATTFQSAAFDLPGDIAARNGADPDAVTITFSSNNDGSDVGIRTNIQDNAGDDSQVTNNFSEAVAGEYYHFFSVDSIVPGALNIASITIDDYRNGAGMDTYKIVLSTDDFATSEELVTGTFEDLGDVTIALAGNVSDISDYQGISSLDVRVFHYDVDGVANTQLRSGFGQVLVEGTVGTTVIPEPASLALLGLGGLCLLPRRRRSH